MTMAPEKEVKIKVTAEGDLKGIQAMEDQIRQLKKEKIQLDIQANTAELDNVNQQLDNAEKKLAEIEAIRAQAHITVDDGQVEALKTEIQGLKEKKIDLEIAVEKGKLDSVEAEVEELDGTTIDLDVDNQTALQAVDQIGQGFDRLKQGAGEVATAMGDVLESAGRMEQTETFLSMNLGADEAKKKLEEIRSVTDKLPGDDVTLQNLLSQAAMKDVSMTTESFTQMGTAAADYMAAMENFGKTSTETQQDLMNYILAGNTAEIERSPILQSHIDKLKEGTTVQERAKLLQEALNEEGWAGIASQDIYNNKLQSFNDMLERGKMNLGNVFLQGSEGAMDFLMHLDEATGGLVGMAAAVGSFASPVADALMGISQIATGMKAIKDLGMIKWLKELEIVTKLSAAADWLLSTAQQVLNFIMIENPIIMVVIALFALAAALIWAYNNVDWFREMVDNAWGQLQTFATWIYGQFVGALDWLSQTFQNTGQIMQDSINNAVNFIITTLQGLWTYITTLGGLIPENTSITGNKVVDAILKVIAFMLTLPLQITMIFTNIIASALGFGDNFSQNMIQGATDAVNGFIEWISSLPGRLQEELDKMIQMAENFAVDIANALTGGAAGMVLGWITGSGESSPGFMYDAFLGELEAMLGLPAGVLGDLANTMMQIGSDMANGFTEAFLGMSLDETITQITESLNYLRESVQGLLDYIYTAGGLLPANVELSGNNIIDTISRVMLFFSTVPVQIGTYLLDTLAQLLGFGPNFTSNLINTGMSAVNGFIQHVLTLPGRVGENLSNVLNRVLSFGGSFKQSLISTATNAVNGFMQYITSLPGKFKGELDKMLGYARDFLVNLPSILKNAAINVVKGWIFGTGERSPGDMYDAFYGELTAMDDLSESTDLPKNMRETARRLVDSFGEPKLRLGADEVSRAVTVSGKGYNGPLQNVTFNFSDIVVDNEERMERIVEYVTRSIAFDNKTAGRTV